MRYREYKNELIGNERVIDIGDAMKSYDSFDDMYETDEGAEYWSDFVHDIMSEWWHLNKDNDKLKSMIMYEFDLESDVEYEDFIFDNLEAYEWFCDNSVQNEYLSVISEGLRMSIEKVEVLN